MSGVLVHEVLCRLWSPWPNNIILFGRHSCLQQELYVYLFSQSIHTSWKRVDAYIFGRCIILCYVYSQIQMNRHSGSTFLWILYDYTTSDTNDLYEGISLWVFEIRVLRYVILILFKPFSDDLQIGIHDHIHATKNHYRDYILYIKLTTDLTRPAIVIYPLHMSFLRYICIMYNILVSPWYRWMFYRQQCFVGFLNINEKWRTDILFTYRIIKIGGRAVGDSASVYL